MAVLGGGGGTSANIQSFAFTSSRTWSPSFDCKAMVYVIGAGGSGASIYLYQAANYLSAGSGGAAGGCATSLLDLKSAHTYTMTIGAGGVATAQTYNTGSAGAAGGNTTFVDGSGTISTMTGNGGGGGNYQVSSSANASAAGATGGAASGGTLGNVTGGGSGAASKTHSAGAYGYVVTGGGAVGINGVGYSSGSISTGGWTGGNPVATGGAGVGGSSGGWSSTSAGNYAATAGGSANGPSADGSNTVTIVSGPVGLGDGFNPANALSLGGSGGAVNASAGQGADNTGNIAQAAMGAGGGPFYEWQYKPWVGQAGGTFAGGGPCCMGNQSIHEASVGGAGGLGGGGGAGGRRNASNYSSSQGGAGGAGVIIIQILEKS